jgi:molecular chaperone DnaK
LLDVTPLSLGIETMGGVFTKLIASNTTIPTKKSEVFSTAADNQPSVEIHVLQGEREMAQYNRTIGRFHLDGIPPAPRGMPKIEVTFDVDANGILHVSAKDQGTGKEQKIRIEASSGLTDAEIQKMKQEAQANADNDKREKEKVEKINQADSMIFQTEKQLKEYGDKLSDGNKTAINSALEKLREAHKAQDLAGIDAALTALNNAWQASASEMYQGGAQAGGPQAGADANANSAGANGNPDVSDVQYEEVK